MTVKLSNTPVGVTPKRTDIEFEGVKVAEINADGIKGDGVSYDNTSSGLAATNVKEAIDELAGSVEALETPVAGEVLQVITQVSSGTATSSTNAVTIQSTSATITPRLNNSTLVCIVTFGSSIQNLNSVNTTASYRIAETASGSFSSTVTLASPSSAGGVGANSPSALTLVYNQSGGLDRYFVLQGWTNNSSIVLSAYNIVCTVLEVAQ